MGSNRDVASEVGLGESWHEVLNTSSIQRLVTLSHPSVEGGGPHGTRRGTKVL
jgi:hypothetical protein